MNFFHFDLWIFFKIIFESMSKLELSQTNLWQPSSMVDLDGASALDEFFWSWSSQIGPVHGTHRISFF
jgi:hypothetical protein